MNVGLDFYDRHARLRPGLILLLPATLTVIALAPDAILGWGGAVAAIVQAGGAFLLAQIIGDIGKKKEPALFKTFGGRPTERLLSHKYAPNKVRLAQRHAKLKTLLPALNIPTAKEEKQNPKGAFEVYAACTDKLRAITRDKEKHPSVIRENVHYGFRRNLWAVKPAGLFISTTATVIVGAELYGYISVHQPVNLLMPIIFGINFFFIVMWLLMVRPSWIQRAAQLYADRLLEALDTL